MLVFDQVSFYYQKNAPILQELQFTIRKGEYVAVVGLNGSGKSTMAKLMNGLFLPKKGKVTCYGQATSDIANIQTIRQHVGYIFQNPEDQFITTSVFDEIIFGLENIHIPREVMEDRVNEALEAVGMSAFQSVVPHLLSGGQKQKIAVAAVLAMQPDFIIFDEATSMLDPKGREDMVLIMERMHEMGIAIIHITHHMEEVLHAPRVLFLHNGRLQFDGTPQHFFSIVDVEFYGIELPFVFRLAEALQVKEIPDSHWRKLVDLHVP
ncbi:ATP-binding cassette domain-containing protein [Virgibacillus sp. FSP13]